MTTAGIDDLLDRLRSMVRDLDPASLTGAAASDLVERFAAVERLGAAGKVLVARRVVETRSWTGGAAPSAAHWVAAVTGGSLGEAADVLEVGRCLVAAPATEVALREGTLSMVRAREVAGAAAVDPAAEASLLGDARDGTLRELRDHCRRVRAASGDADAAYRRIHRRRSLRRWTDTDGTFRLDGRFTPDAGARIWARIEDESVAVAADARRAGVSEPSVAYAADALDRLVAGTPASRPRTTVNVRVDHTAYWRGRVEPGERCEIDGAGPVPVAVAHRLAREAFVTATRSDGADITAVSHLGRTINARLRTALVERDPVCVVPGCDNRRFLEIDHVVPVAMGGPTELANLARLCSFHHRQKTVDGFRLAGGPGRWRWEAPLADSS